MLLIKNDRLILEALLEIFNKNQPLLNITSDYASLKQLHEKTGLNRSKIVSRINALIVNGYLQKESDIAEHGGHLTNFFIVLKPIPLLNINESRFSEQSLQMPFAAI